MSALKENPFEFSILGLSRYQDYEFKPQLLFNAPTESKALGLHIRTSSIANAGVGVFAAQRMRGGHSGRYLCDYAGEPMPTWMYDCIEDSNTIVARRDNGDASLPELHYTGVAFHVAPLPAGVWRGISGTLGPSINATKRSQQANVELRINPSTIDRQGKVFHGTGFIQVWIKAGAVIDPSEELLLFYSQAFWQQLHRRQYEWQEPYCCICLLFHSTRSDRMYLCDRCNNGFHQLCMYRLNREAVPDNNETSSWYCASCNVDLNLSQSRNNIW